ncbi:Chitin-inducible gibberellin-responsive protein 1 [Linum perenne]
MDTEQLFGFGTLTGSGISSYSSPYPTVSSLPDRLSGTLKFEIGNSPGSPFSTQLDNETVSSVSDSQEKPSSTRSLSGFSPSGNSSAESNSYLNQRNNSLQLFPCLTSSISHSSPDMKQALQQLETALMGPDEDMAEPNDYHGESGKSHAQGEKTSRGWGQEERYDSQPRTTSMSHPRQLLEADATPVEKRHKAMAEESSSQSSQPNNLKQLLIECAKALAENNMTYFDNLVNKARGEVSITGEPIQRLGAYLVEGLVARKQLSGNNIYRALRCREPDSKDLLSYMQILYEICPYLKFGYMAANGAIAEACRNAEGIHIIDFQICQGTQWMTLLQALAARPGGAPHVRITGIDDPLNKYARGGGLDAVEKRLGALSDKFNIRVEFQGLPVFAPDVTREMLDVRPGEALAVNLPLQLHHTPDESVDVNNPRDGLLRMIKSLNPKVTTLVEQESNTNTTPFLTRFVETLEYYMAIFESIDVTLDRVRKERIGLEQHCLARDMVNVVACEGRERVERHELFGKWKSRFTMAGFKQYPLSSYVNSVIKSLLKCYSEHYTLVERDGAMLLGWKERNLVSASAWY